MCVRVCLALLMVAALPAWAGPPGAVVTEAQVKAGFIYNCARFIEWPDAVAHRDFVIGVVGETLDSVLNDAGPQRVNGRAVRVKGFGPGDDPREYHLLFIAGGDARSTAALLARVAEAPVLTIGESPDFTERGGVIRLYTEQQRLRFDINTTQAARAGLRISAKMMGLAKLVR